MNDDRQAIAGDFRRPEGLLIALQIARGHPDRSSAGQSRLDPGRGSSPLDIDADIRVQFHVFLGEDFSKRLDRRRSSDDDLMRLLRLATAGQYKKACADQENPGQFKQTIVTQRVRSQWIHLIILQTHNCDSSYIARNSILQATKRSKQNAIGSPESKPTSIYYHEKHRFYPVIWCRGLVT